MSYASLFLHQSQYCHTIVGVNWTRWNHTDENLFDLIDQNLPRLGNERSSLTKDLLRADLRFQHHLAQLNAPWAEKWRLALRQTEWAKIKELVSGLDAGTQLLHIHKVAYLHPGHGLVDPIGVARRVRADSHAPCVP